MRKFLLFIVISFALANFYSCDDFEEIPIKEVNTNFSEDSEDSYEEETTEDFTYNFSDFLNSSYSSESSESSHSFDFSDISGYEDDISETTEAEKTTEETTETTTVSTETTTETEQTETTSTETTTATTTTTKAVNEDLVLLDVPYMSQKDKYPTGCELVSASMLLKYYGFDITAGEFIENGYIEKKEPERDSDKDVIYCADPNKFFIGDPYTESGYGCYAPALVNAMKKYLDGKFCDVVNLSGMSLDDLCMEYIDLDEPVIIWASVDMKPTEKKEKVKCVIKETGKEFSWISNEHCLVLVGYDNHYYYFNDPQSGCAVPYRKSDVEARYEELGRQAVIVRLW